MKAPWYFEMRGATHPIRMSHFRRCESSVLGSFNGTPLALVIVSNVK